MWTGVGSGILPFKVLEILELSDIEIFGYGLDKNGALGLISLVGLAIAAGVQIAAGSLSDRDKGIGKRLPYLLVGGIGLAIITFLFGYVTTFVSLFATFVVLQLFGNFGQGPANALIIDHVAPARRGQASGILNLWRLLGAGIITVIVLQFMANYDYVDARKWMWYSIILMSTVLISSVLWTVLSLRPRNGLAVPGRRQFSSETITNPKKFVEPRFQISRRYSVFLIGLVFSVAAM